MIPLDAVTSAMVTLASLTMTPPSATVNATSSPLAMVAAIPSVTAEDGTEPAYTWYSRMSVRVALPSSLSRAARSIPAAANASSVGAKTVNGPSPWRVASSSAWITAATSESCTPVPEATVGMSATSPGGISTLSMAWMIPLDAIRSDCVTVASLTITVPLESVKPSESPLYASTVIPSVISSEATAPRTTW